ncbi:toprim domain-containing protein [Halomonas sp. NO4]|uniref:DUF7146 domain-containing protein n=1 Tax=Halomonas sp. NO4 TaxID=2484813 RepID=UPI0013D78ED3|nr:toprim domain-containing protein [Halomonas sp. NO4]
MKMPTREIARHRWQSILLSMGLPAKYLSGKHMACPLCGEGEDRFRWDNKDGRGTYYCSQCGPGDGFQLASGWTGKSFTEVAREIDDILGNRDPVPAPQPEKQQDEAARTRRRLQRIGRDLQPVGDLDPVARYLRHRGIKRIPRDHLRYHPSLPFFDGGPRPVAHYPAMVAAFRRSDGAIETFHVTYLTRDGYKAPVDPPRKVTGKQQGLPGCAIRLSEVERHIGIAEGVETALSVTELYGLPCWSCYSANGLETFEPPEGVEEISIFADADENFAGQDAATSAARRLTKAGYTVRLAQFLRPGLDYNDLLEEG